MQPPKTHFFTFSCDTKIMKITHSALASLAIAEAVGLVAVAAASAACSALIAEKIMS